MCHVSHVTCHMSPVTCLKNNLHLNFFLLLFIHKKIDKVVELFGGGSVIDGAHPIYFLLCCKIVCNCVIRLCTLSSRVHNRIHFSLLCCQATPDYQSVLYLIFCQDAVVFKPSGCSSVEAVLTVSAIMRLLSAALSLVLASTVAAQVKTSSLP